MSEFAHSLHPRPDRTPQRLEFTVQVAEGTLNRSAEVLQSITPISSKVEEWANNMRKNEYSTDAYEKAVVSAGDAGIELVILLFIVYLVYIMYHL